MTVFLRAKQLVAILKVRNIFLVCLPLFGFLLELLSTNTLAGAVLAGTLYITSGIGIKSW
jgi:hypothetical protein